MNTKFKVFGLTRLGTKFKVFDLTRLGTKFKVFDLTRLGIKTQSTAPEANALTVGPSELLIGTCYNFTINVVQWRYETVANRLVTREIC